MGKGDNIKITQYYPPKKINQKDGNPCG